MLLYCPKCQNLIDKTDDTKTDGETVVYECQKCQNKVSFYIKYVAKSMVVQDIIDNMT
jgi:DNA-directed RNA polymerase subunit M/transcription elongation factor TFIIS